MILSSTSPSSVTTALRWRARVVKDAVHPELGTADDSRVHFHSPLSTPSHDEELPNNHQDDRHKEKGLPISPHRIWFLTRSSPFQPAFATRTLSLFSMISTLYAAWQVKGWIIASQCTCIMALSLLLLYQVERLHSLRNIRAQIQTTRRAHSRLTQQGQKLSQQVQYAHDLQNQLQHVDVQMQQLRNTSQKSVGQLQQLARQWQDTQRDMRIALYQRLQQEVLRVVLDSDANGNFVLQDKELKVLALRLKQIPGVETMWKEPEERTEEKKQDESSKMWLDDDDLDQDRSDGGISVIALLRQLQAPARPARKGGPAKPWSTNEEVRYVRLTETLSVRLDPTVVPHARPAPIDLLDPPTS